MLELARTVYDVMVDHARKGAPAEMCGVLVGMEHGEDEQGVTAVERAIATENVADHPNTTYRIDPEELFEVIETAESVGQEVVGFYHSHPTGPRGPSQTDVAQATWDGYPYLIVSLDGAVPFVDGWRWNGERFVPEPIRVVG